MYQMSFSSGSDHFKKYGSMCTSRTEHSGYGDVSHKVTKNFDMFS
jgi:hypothetical protein